MDNLSCGNMFQPPVPTAKPYLETAVEYYRVPANASTTKPALLRSFLTADNAYGVEKR